MKLPVAGWPALLTLGLLATGLAGCSAMWNVGTPDFSTWFTRDNSLLVNEIANDPRCRAAGEQIGLTLLDGSAAVASWQAQRGLQLLDPATHDSARYVVVDLGNRPSGGYGLAISRQAALRQNTLVLKATIFEPRHDIWAAAEVTSPCALVRLPTAEFGSLKLIDQAGKLRASAGS